MSKRRAAREILKRRKGRRSLIGFTSYTKEDFHVSEHHRVICEALESVAKGETKRLMIFAPPRHTKSELASRRFPAWYLGNNPEKQIIATTYGHDFASDFGRDVRDIIQSDSYQTLFPDVKLKKDSKSANRWHTSHGGVYISTGVGGSITGRGAHIALIDDPVKNRDEADSENYRERTKKWYTSTLRTRLMPGGAVVVILTRWHEDDLAGWLLEEARYGGEQWEVVNLQAIKDEGTDKEKALWPQWYDLDELKNIKRALGPRDWSALYQQNPTTDDGTFFKREWFHRYRFGDEPRQLNSYQCGDYAVTDSGGDFTEFGIFSLCPNLNVYVEAWWHGQESADVWIEAQLEQIRQYQPYAVFGETGVIRKAVEPFLKRRGREKKIFYRQEWITRTSDKAASARSFQALAASGRVYIPYCDWGERLIDQLCKFPTGKHDDAVDVCALMGMAINMSHGAILATPEKKKTPDMWDLAFDNEEEDTWKLA